MLQQSPSHLVLLSNAEIQKCQAWYLLLSFHTACRTASSSPRSSCPELSPKAWQVLGSGVIGLQSAGPQEASLADSLARIYLEVGLTLGSTKD